MIRIIVIFLFSYSLGIAQPGILTEEEIQDQDLFLKAKTQVLLGKLDKAEEIYLKLIKSSPKNDVIAYELSRLYLNLSDDENTERYIKKAIQNNDRNPWYYRFYARFLENKEQYDKAAEEYVNLLASYPRNTEYLLKHADLSSKAAKYKDALASYAKIQELEGVSEMITKKRFDIFTTQGKEKEAVNELQILVNSFPTKTRYLTNLASYYNEIGKSKDAKKAYQRVLQIDPENPTALMALSSPQKNVGSENSYLQSLTKLIENPGISIDKKVIELVPYVEDINKLDLATQHSLLNLLSLLEQSHNENPKAKAIHGDAAFSLADYETAIEKYTQTLNLTKRVFPVWQNLMVSLHEIEKFDQLDKVAKEATNLYPNQAVCYYYTAIASANLINPKMSKEDQFLRGIKDYEVELDKSYELAVDNFDEALLMSSKNAPLKYTILKSAIDVAINFSKFDDAQAYLIKAKTIEGANLSELEKIGNQINTQLQNN